MANTNGKIYAEGKARFCKRATFRNTFNNFIKELALE